MDKGKAVSPFVLLSLYQLLLYFCDLEFHLLLHLPCHLSSGPAPSSSVALPFTAEQLLFQSKLYCMSLQDGPCRWLVV